MLVLKRVEKKSITEAKQVGSIYHVTNLESVANYIAPTDTLSASGKYHNYMLNRNDVISFTRNKKFVVKTQGIQESVVLFRFKCNGDKLSEKYKIKPYNDFAYDQDTGKKDLDGALYSPEDLESEEVVLKSIKNFSKYVESVQFNAVLRNFDDICKISKLLQKSLDYLNKFTITYDPNLIVKGTWNDILYQKIPFSSFTEFKNFIFTLDDFIKGNDINTKKVKKYLALLDQRTLNSYLNDLTNFYNGVKSEIIQVLIDAGASAKEINLSHLYKDDLLKLGKYISDKDKIKYIKPFITMDMLNLDTSLITDPHFTKEYFNGLKGEKLYTLLYAVGVVTEEELNDILIDLYNI